MLLNKKKIKKILGITASEMHIPKNKTMASIKLFEMPTTQHTDIEFPRR